MWVDLSLTGLVNGNGVLLGLDFATVKRHFRNYLDTFYDHRLLLNETDPLLNLLVKDVDGGYGANACTGDPTTENIARWIGEWAMQTFEAVDLRHIKVEVAETHCNGAEWEAEVRYERT